MAKCQTTKPKTLWDFDGDTFKFSKQLEEYVQCSNLELQMDQLMTNQGPFWNLHFRYLFRPSCTYEIVKKKSLPSFGSGLILLTFWRMYFARLQKGKHSFWLDCLFNLVNTFVMVSGGTWLKLGIQWWRFDSHQVVWVLGVIQLSKKYISRLQGLVHGQFRGLVDVQVRPMASRCVHVHVQGRGLVHVQVTRVQVWGLVHIQGRGLVHVKVTMVSGYVKVQSLVHVQRRDLVHVQGGGIVDDQVRGLGQSCSRSRCRTRSQSSCCVGGWSYPDEASDWLTGLAQDALLCF